MRKLMWFAVGFALSCVIGIYFSFGEQLLPAALSVIILAVVLCLFKKKPTVLVGIILIGASAGLVWTWGYNAIYLQAARTYDGTTVTGRVTIADYSYETTYAIAADADMELGGKTFRVRVYLNETEALTPGDSVTGDFRIRMTTQGSLEDPTYHQAEGIFLLAYSQGDAVITRMDTVPAKYFPAKLRMGIQSVLDSVFPDDTLGFARGLLLGDSSRLSYEEDTAFKVSGIRHIIAVSGLHVSILFSLLYMFSGKRRLSTAVLGIPLLVLFAAVAGFTPSVTRACVMQLLMILALLFNKEYDPPTALAFSTLVMLCVNPMVITSASFQLSVGCIIGIFLFSNRIGNYLLRLFRCPGGKSLRARLTYWIAGSVSVSLSAMVITTPLCAYYFGLVSIVGLFANLLTLWVVSFIFYGIIISCVLGSVLLPAGKLVAGLISWPIRYVLGVAKLMAKFPFAAVYTCNVYIVLWLIVSYIILLTLLLGKKKHPCVAAACVVGCLCIALAASCLEPRLDNVRVTVMDVGQGQCILLQADNQYYLVDCGGDSGHNAADIAAAQLLSQGITQLDGVLLTHYDADHALGVPDLLTRIDVKTLYLPDIADDGTTKQQLATLYADKVVWITEMTQVSASWGLLTMAPGAKLANENECGMCILFQAGNCDILITGDRSIAGERLLIETVDLPKLELLVVGHHGATNSTGFELLSVTKPELAVVSVGEDNAYGHPSQDVLDRLSLIGCQVLRTDLNGTIIYRR